MTCSGEWPAEVVQGIALLRAMRFLCGGGEDERLTAIRLFAELRLTAPELAPDELFGSVFEFRRHDAELAAAIRSWRAGALAAGSPPTLRLACARQWAELAAAQRDWDLAAEAYDHAVALLPLTSWRGLGRADQEYGLRRQAPVASDAAAAFLGAGQPGSAVAQLESGRAVLWTQQLDMRDSVAALRTSQPALAASLDRVRHALDAVVSALPLASRPW